MDSQREVRARAKLQQLKADSRDMDSYISKFEELARQAGYTVGSPEMINFFLLGISDGELLQEIMKPPVAADYQALKQRAIDHATANQGYHNIIAIQKNLHRQAQAPTSAFQYNQQRQGPRRGFFYRGPQNDQTWRNKDGGQPQYNSSNAPRSMNNTAVPMDIGRSRAGYRGRGRGRGGGRGGYRSNLADLNGQTSNACFNCGTVGHYARNCPNKQNKTARTATAEDEGTVVADNPPDRVAWIKSELASLSQEETGRLADELEPSQDFPNV
jgi:Zinc knuckle